MKRLVVFVSGRYRRSRIEFYKMLCRSARTLAVNGGCRFFIAAGMVPDTIVGDLDSIKSIPRRLQQAARIIKYPAHKDKTDLQLALEHSLSEGVKVIDIVSPEVGQVDHFLGNIMLLGLVNKLSRLAPKIRLRIVSDDCEIHWVHDDRRSFNDRAGETISVIPMSSAIRLTNRGMEYPASRRRIARGHTMGLRNRIISRRASVEVEGQALVVRHFLHGE
jgi:thiamine pyrophosphokinase